MATEAAYISVNNGDSFASLIMESEMNGRSVKRSIELSYRFAASVRVVLKKKR